MSDTSPPRMVLGLRSWLVASYTAVLMLPVVLLLLTGALGNDLRKQTQHDLEHQATILSLSTAALVDAHDKRLDELAPLLDPMLNETKLSTLAGIRIVDPEGIVVSSSGNAAGEDLSNDAEVTRALQGATAIAVKPRPAPTSAPLLSDSRRARVRVFVAEPIRHRGQVIGAVVLSRTPREEVQALAQMVPLGLWWGVLLALALTFGVGWVSARILTRSLSRLARASHQIADGDFDAIRELARPTRSHVREVGEASAAVVRMAERLQLRLAYISEFASGVSHEFKTPLSTLRGTLELLVDDDDMPEAQRQRFFANANRSLERLQRLVDGLLSLARVDEGIDTEPLDLDALIRRVVHDDEAVEVTGNAGTVEGSAPQLESVLRNLLENAFLHGEAPVRITAFTDATSTGFIVRNAGPAISAHNQAHVFERFFTTNREGGGTGLGLALVRAIVEAHGGSVRLESQPGETAFTVSLPLP